MKIKIEIKLISQMKNKIFIVYVRISLVNSRTNSKWINYANFKWLKILAFVLEKKTKNN